MPPTDHAKFQCVVCSDCHGRAMCWPMPEHADVANAFREFMQSIGCKVQDFTRANLVALPRCDCIVPGLIGGPSDAG